MGDVIKFPGGPPKDGEPQIKLTVNVRASVLDKIEVLATKQRKSKTTIVNRSVELHYFLTSFPKILVQDKDGKLMEVTIVE